MFKKEDELSQTAKHIAIRYTYLFQIILLVGIWVVSIKYGNLILIQPIYLMDSSLYMSISLDRSIGILTSTQILVLFAAQTIFNKRLGGLAKPITSGNGGFRFMDERERVISDKSIFVTFLYINILLVAWAIIQIFISGKLELPLIIVVLELIFYMITKLIILGNLGWERS